MLAEHEAQLRISSLSPSHERRTERRLPVELDVVVGGSTCRFRTTTADVSPSGMFIATHEPLIVGAVLHLGFALPGGSVLEVLATVQWRRGDLDVATMPGVGVSFARLDAATKATLERFCALREPLYYEDALPH